MAISNSLKKGSNKKRRHFAYKNRLFSNATIKSLPKDILIEVVAMVASHSFVDLHNMKKCCKDFLEASEDKYVWRHVSLENLTLVTWRPNEKLASFLKGCLKSGNIESLYRKGLFEYFNHRNLNVDSGLKNLKVAAEMGHNEAKYVYGMILLGSENEDLKKEGVEHMNYLRKCKCVIRCREKVEKLIEGNKFWRNRRLVRNEISLCNSKNKCKGWRLKKGVWCCLDDEDDDDDVNSCECCRWDHELEFFYQLFNYY